MKKPKKDKIKILHITEGIFIGDLERFLVDLINNCDSNKFSFAIAVFKKTSNFFTKRLNSLKIPLFLINKKNPLYIFNNFKPDIIHVHTDWSARISEFLCQLEQSSPVVQTGHGWTRILPVSPAVRKIVLSCRALKEIQSQDERMEVIFGGIDFSIFRPRNRKKEMRRKLGLSPKDFVIGMVSRLEPGKCDLDTINMFIEIVKQRPFVKTVIIGGGELYGCFKKQIEDKGVQNNFLLLGFRKDVNELLEVLDIYIHPVIAESFGIAVLEAMAMGLPIVSSAVGGIKDTIINGKSGILAKNFLDAARKTIELIDRSSLRKKLKSKARLRAKFFNIKKSARKYEVLYKQLITQPIHKFYTIPKNIKIKGYFANKNHIVNKGMVSIVIPVYNYGRFLRDCLDSVFSQTYKNFEVIIVDDGSQDGTNEILKEYAFDSRLKILYKPINSGIAESLNIGLRLSSGEFLSRIDADDMVSSTWLETLTYFLNKDKSVGMVYPDMQYFGNLEYISRRPFLSEKLFFKKPLISLGHIFRREALECVGGYRVEFPSCEDFDMHLRIDEQFKIVHIPIALYKYRFHSDSFSTFYKKLFKDLDLKAQEASLVRRGFVRKNEKQLY